MASSSRSSFSRKPGDSWTSEENKRFEVALALYEEGAPDRWHNVAMAVGGKTAEQVRRHFEKLLSDIELIDSAQEPLFNYAYCNNRRCTGTSGQEQRLRFLNLQRSRNCKKNSNDI